ncbi:AraC family transcriptional regulator [Aquimarina sp. TRL1]|uniref:helix-turn-helix domain-containing protein n=1 Tax=Aquimarina sp. (strain TRL1) TaxID=2736252 RepID=UPI00158F32C7|nr:helix-turn-helix domain-containing protein [Aquimarina sp. TRL1]QKX06077.1 AraC family transcriptional regulator [Aquimarina sp. TRL1]
MEEIITFLIYSGISVTLFLVLLLSRKWKSGTPPKVLSYFLISYLILFLTLSSSYLENDTISFFIFPIGIVIPFAMGTLLFFYIKAIYYHKLVSAKVILAHLIPFFLAILLCSIPAYHMNNMGQNIKYNISYSIPCIGLIHFGFYIFKSYKLLRESRSEVKQYYASLYKNDLKWLAIWVKGFFLFFIIDLISGLLISIFTSSLEFVIYFQILYLVSLIWYLGYYGIHQTTVFLPSSILSEEDTSPPSSTSIVHIDCQSEELILARKKLETIFTDQELFKKQDLSLRETAVTLELSNKKLSHILNECLQTNFYEYVNTHRVRYFCKKVKEGDAEKLTLLAIAYEAGFNSKATFNRVFKKQTGMTPIQFKKQV